MSFAFQQTAIAGLRARFGSMAGMDPDGPLYRQIIAELGRMDAMQLKLLAAANIRFVSLLAANRLAIRKAH